jgi:hypothetical protein
LGNSPDGASLFLAAHAVREMMNELPKTMDLPTFAGQVRLGDKMSAFEPQWKRARRSRCNQDGKWFGEIDDILRQLLTDLDELLQWWIESRPKRKDLAKQVFKLADPAGLRLPEPLESIRAQRWLDALQYFISVAHRAPTTVSQFESRLGELEQIILDALFRRPSVDFSAIDAILSEEGASDA